MPHNYNDQELIILYSYWSEENWAAGFMKPDRDIVASFRKWIHLYCEHPRNLLDYEQELLAEYRRQEGE